MMKFILTLLLVGCCLIGCGGGGGGDSRTSETDEQQRAQAFRDEAVRLATDDAMVTCQTIMCPLADGEGENVRPDGTVGHGCNWNCLESRIDDSGETRNYVIWLRWERLPDGCFGPPDVLIATENLDVCVPNQDRFLTMALRQTPDRQGCHERCVDETD